MKRIFLIISIFLSLTALAQTPAQEYYMLLQQNANPCTDADACAYINRLAAAGYATTTAQQDSINNFVINMKANGFYAKCLAIYPFLGANALTHAMDLKNTYNLTMSGTIGYTVNGVNWGTTGYGQTGIIPSSVMSVNDAHISYYNGAHSGTGSVIEIGAQNSASQKLALFLGGSGSGNTIVDMFTTSQRLTVTNANNSGFHVASRSSSTSLAIYRNGSSIGSIATAHTGTLPGYEIYLGALNNAGTAISFTNKGSRFASIGTSLDAGEAATFSTLVNNLQIAFNRNTF